MNYKWRPAYVQLMIGNEPISRPRAVKACKQNELWIFEKNANTYPCSSTRPEPIYFVLMSYEDIELGRQKLADRAIKGMIAKITVRQRDGSNSGGN